MKNVLGLVLKATVTMALVACGGQSSDPLKDYDTTKLQKKHDKKSDTQVYEVDKFSVEILGSNEKNYGNFIEGQQGELNIRIFSEVAVIENPSFDIVNFPSSNEPRITRVKQDQYKLLWTPSAGTIPQGQTQTEINFQVNVSASGQVDEVKTLFLVSRTNKVPKISGTSGLNVKAEEGQTIAFTVDIQDPNYNGNGTPEVLISPYMNSNIEAFMANGSTFVFQNYKQKQNPVQLGQDTFRFYYEMKLEKLPDLLDRKGILDPNAASVQLCFNLRALSVVQTTSGTVQHCVEARYKAQPAKITFKSSDRKVIAGQKNLIEFNVSSDDKVSLIDIKNSKTQIANLSGEKEMICTGAASNSMECQLSWTPPCNIKANAQTLKLKLESSLNNKAKSTSVDEEFAIDTSTCAAQAVAKIEADKKLAEEKAAAQAAATKKVADDKAIEKAAAAQKIADAKAKVAADKAAVKAKADEAKAKKALEDKAKADAVAEAKKSEKKS